LHKVEICYNKILSAVRNR